MNTQGLYWLLIGVFILASCQPVATAVPSEAPMEITEETSSALPTEELTTTETQGLEQPTAEFPVQEPVPFTPQIGLKLHAGGFTAPVDLDAPQDGSGRLFVTDQVGLIYIIENNDNRLETPFLDLRSRLVNINRNYDERGLLGMAFHPNYAENGRFFVYYSAPPRAETPSGWEHTSILSEFTVAASDPNTADPDSERIILMIDQPQSNHNSGAIAFGPDGYLYIPLGDGGGANDTGLGHAEDWYTTNAGGNGQDVEATMLGSVLRIDIDNGDPYAVPADNPKISQNFPEIWAFGFRNPYRMAFDPEGDRELFLGDAGQNLWEEVSIVTAGGNYGWNVREGAHCFSTASPRNPGAIVTCPMEDPSGNPLIDPIIEFRNSNHPEGGLGTSVIGGVVYRGESLPAWDGRYVFGQWSTSFRSPQGGLFVATRPDAGTGMWDFEPVRIENREGGQLNEFLLGFGQDTQGEIYLLTSLSTGPNGDTGSVYMVIPPENSSVESD